MHADRAKPDDSHALAEGSPVVRRRRAQRRWKPAKKGMLGISDVAEAVGVSETVLRAWEMRYQWPKPSRDKNGYRTYSGPQVEALRSVIALMQRGRSISDILSDQNLGILEGRVPSLPPARRSALRLHLDFAGIPAPTSNEGARLRVELEDALRHANAHQVARIESEALRLRPTERQLLERLVAYAASVRGDEQIPLKRI